jgi:hypothetical protein
VTQAEREERMGTMLLRAHSAPTGAHVWRSDVVPFEGPVEVHLFPFQDAANTETSVVTYWGEALTLPAVVQEVIYEPQFDVRPEYRAYIHEVVNKPRLQRRDGKLLISLYAESGIKLVFNVVLSTGAEEEQVGNWTVMPRVASACTLSVPDPFPYWPDMTVILRPDADWMMHTQDMIPPWGEPLRFPLLPIEQSK